MKRRLFAESRILHRLGRITDGLYDSASKSAIGRGLTAYDAETRDAERSLIAKNAGKKLSKLKIHKFKMFVAESVERSPTIGLFNAFMSRLASSYVRQYGVFAFAFAIYGALMYFLSNFVIKPMTPLPLSYAIIEGAVLLLSVPMIAVKKTAAYVLCQSRLANAILFDLLGIRKESVTAYGKGEKRLRFAFIYGTAAGLLTVFVPPLRMIAIICMFLIGYTVVVTPEAGLILAVLVIPFIPTAELGVLMIYVTPGSVAKAITPSRSSALTRVSSGR